MYDVRKDTLSGDEVECPEHESDLIAHEVHKLGFSEFAYILSGDINLASCRAIEAADQVHERALARA